MFQVMEAAFSREGIASSCIELPSGNSFIYMFRRDKVFILLIGTLTSFCAARRSEIGHRQW
jgi:hypothetical protein